MPIRYSHRNELVEEPPKGNPIRSLVWLDLDMRVVLSEEDGEEDFERGDLTLTEETGMGFRAPRPAARLPRTHLVQLLI